MVSQAKTRTADHATDVPEGVGRNRPWHDSASFYRACPKSRLSASDAIAVIRGAWDIPQMKNHWFVLAILMPAAIALVLWWTQTPSLSPEEQILFTKLDLATSHSPPREKDVVAAFGRFDGCRGITCFDKQSGRLGALHYSDRTLTLQDEGFVFEIGGFSRACIRTDRVKTHFGTEDPKQSCFDAVCWYTRAQRSWGIVTFQLEAPDAPCVKSAVINSSPEQRPKGWRPGDSYPPQPRTFRKTG